MVNSIWPLLLYQTLVCNVNGDLWSLNQVDIMNLFQIQSPRSVLGLSVLIKSTAVIARGTLLLGVEPATRTKHHQYSRLKMQVFETRYSGGSHKSVYNTVDIE